MSVQITLKNVKYAAFASEETPCFEATVYVDGKRFCKVRNDGHGGCDDYYPLKPFPGLQNEIYDRIKGIDAELLAEFGTHRPDWVPEDSDFTHPVKTFESEVYRALDDHLILKDIRRALRSKVAFFEGEFTGNYRFYATSRTRPEKGAREVIARKYPTATILNDLSEEELVKLWRDAA